VCGGISVKAQGSENTLPLAYLGCENLVHMP